MQHGGLRSASPETTFARFQLGFCCLCGGLSSYVIDFMASCSFYVLINLYGLHGISRILSDFHKTYRGSDVMKFQNANARHVTLLDSRLVAWPLKTFLVFSGFSYFVECIFMKFKDSHEFCRF